ncbi:MAG TPA: SDR family NAD(P)-dependent oxidoreductase [Baekduia sp.]|nr:SDR family NAD(P)-dependent oxidoreductase [Baekduia sp.]
MSGAFDVIWISGASSGIGAALAASAPASARVIGISRRPSVAGAEHVGADLADPASWPAVGSEFEAVLSSGEVQRAAFLHFAGIGSPYGHALGAPLDEYRRSVLLNAACGQVLGQAFLALCERHAVTPTLVQCSSPAAIEPMAGMTHYGPGKRAIEHWLAAIALERPQVAAFAVVPWAVDTPMLRGGMAAPPDEHPLAPQLNELAARGDLATPEDTAQEIWALVEAGVAPGSVHDVGAVPAEARRS